jgi:ABC-type multidrug transport system permease subunit
MTKFGLPASYGVHILVGQGLASVVWLVSYDLNLLAYDLQGPKTISYELTLPITYRLIYLKYVLAAMIKGALVNLAALPVCALLIAQDVNVAAISPGTFLGGYLLAALLMAFFCMLLTVIFKNADALNSFWMRWGMALWMFSGLYTPWYVMAKAAAWAGYLTLLNPFLYAFEATHAAFMGQQQFINFWWCIIAMIGFIVLFAYVGMYRFKKRLDCV